MSDEDREQMARTLEEQFTTRGFYQGLQQQLRVRRRDEADRTRDARERWRTPGLLTNIGRGTRDLLGAASDWMATPFRALAERSDRVEEDLAAFERGEHIRRFQQSELIRNEHDRRLAFDAMRSGDFERLTAVTGRDPLAPTGLIDNARSMNRLGHLFRLTSYSSANKLVRLGNQSTRSLFGISTTYGSTDVAQQQLQDVSNAARLIRAGAGRSADAAGEALARISTGKLDAMSVVLRATAKLKNVLPQAALGGALSAGATGGDLFRKSAIAALTESGLNPADAERMYRDNEELLGGEMARQVYLTNNQRLIEPMEKALDLADRAGGVDLRQQREHLAEEFKKNLGELGISSLGSKTIESVKNVVKNTDPKVLAIAAAVAGGNDKELQRIQSTFGSSREGHTAFIRASRDASSLLQAQGKDVQEALRIMGGDGQENLDRRIEKIRDTVSISMALQAFETTAQRIGEEVGDSHLGSARSVRDLMDRLQGKSLDSISNKSQLSAIRAWREASGHGDEKGMAAAEDAFAEAALSTGAQSGSETFGGIQSSGTADIDRQIAELEEAKQKFATDKPEGKTQALFASSVEVFAQAARDLKSATENIAVWNAAHQQVKEW